MTQKRIAQEIKRVEVELANLRKELGKPEQIIYEPSKYYVLVITRAGSEGYYVQGTAPDGKYWFRDWDSVISGWSTSSTGQELLDGNAQEEIRVFDTFAEAAIFLSEATQ